MGIITGDKEGVDGGILKRSGQNHSLLEQEKTSYISAIVMMGIFTFLFLCAEYLYVDIISFSVSEGKAVTAQNYALGISMVGFILYPVFNRFCKNTCRTILSILITASSVVCVFLICRNISYGATLISGLILFLFLGLIGSAVFYISVCMLPNDKYLARTVGISYMLGILLQFANNNLVPSEAIEAIILSVFLIVLVLMLMKQERTYGKNSIQNKSEAVLTGAENVKNDKEKSRGAKGNTAGLLLILLVILMSCVFSTLDNAVTLVHATGEADIGQLPRILLAFSGLAAGFLFDIKDRKFMSLIMYCVMMLSTICIAVLKFAGPFLTGLIIFYMTAGFFAVFFTTSFMELSRFMRLPDLWAGLGRAVNNITAAVITGSSLALLSSDDNIMVIILAVLLFVAVSVVAAAYIFQRNKLMGGFAASAADNLNEEERLQRVAEKFSFTPREAEVFNRLVSTEDSMQEIAESMYVSKRTLERYVSAIYEKTGVKSRVGLLNIYNNR